MTAAPDVPLVDTGADPDAGVEFLRTRYPVLFTRELAHALRYSSDYPSEAVIAERAAGLWPALLSGDQDWRSSIDDGAVDWLRIGCDRLVEPRLLTNQARCGDCGETISSSHRHDFVSCSCGSLSVDGGLDYLKRGFRSDSGWEELSTTETAEAILARLADAETR